MTKQIFPGGPQNPSGMPTQKYVPFQQQIAFFRNKKNVLTESWLDLWQSEHDNGFITRFDRRH